MLFSSQPFLMVFLPLMLVGYYLLAHTRILRIAFLVAGSCFFYAWWNPDFLPLLLISITINWGLGQLLRASRRARLLLVIGICANLGLLALFKYARFLGNTWQQVSGHSAPDIDLVLPLAISFFTFQHIAYLVDASKGTAPKYTWLEFTCYVTFFPHLIAGPIVRHSELVSQFAASPLRPGAAEFASRGLLLLTMGLFKKVVIADEISALVDPVFAVAGAGQIPDLQAAWTAAVAFSMQLYFDFSGYSDMAIGLAALFGLHLPINFNAPYQATSIRDFWRRWHMTLSRFFRDYLYIPLGGNRRGLLQTMAVVMTTMLLCGLWHGAGWTFVAWGGFHGAGICIQNLWSRTAQKIPAGLAYSLTLLFVILGWVLFRAENFESAWRIFEGMAGLGAQPVQVKDKLGLLLLGVLLATMGPTSQRVAFILARPSRMLAVSVGLALMVIMMRVGAGRSLDFIYFQF